MMIVNNVPILEKEGQERNAVKHRRSVREAEEVRGCIHLLYKFSHYEHHHSNDDLPRIIANVQSAISLMASYGTVKRVIEDSKKALDNNIFYDSSRKSWLNAKKRKIQEGSVDEHLITVLKEKTSYETATHIYNLLVSSPRGDDFISTKAIYNAIQRTRHTKRRPTKVGQASDDRFLWKRARLIYCLQYLVRLGGQAMVTEQLLDLHGINDKIKFDYHHLKERDLTIDSVYRIAFWDEVHFQQEVGEGREVFLSFPRDEFGTYDKSKEEDEKTADRVSNRNN